MKIAPRFQILFLGLALCGGCVAPKNQVQVSPDSYVDKQLRDASESISRDMAILAGSTQNRDQGGSLPGGDLYSKMNLHWDGPIDGALARVAAHAGFKLIIEGDEPTVPPHVHIRMEDRPCLAIFREIGMQTGAREGVVVSEEGRFVVLRYINDEGGI